MGHVYASCVTCLTSDTCCAPCCAPRQEVLRIGSATFRPKDAANCALDVLHECEKAVQSALVNKNNPSKIVWSQRVFCAQAIFEQLLRPLFASQTVLLGPAVQGTVVFVYHELARVAFLLRESFLCAQWPAIDRTASVVCDEKHPFTIKYGKKNCTLTLGLSYVVTRTDGSVVQDVVQPLAPVTAPAPAGSTHEGALM